MMKVQEWVDYDNEIPEDQTLGWLGGWFNFNEKGQRWKDYLEAFQLEVHPYLEAVRESVIEHGIRITGDQHQHSSDGVPKFSDGKYLLLSFRAWGDLMAAIWSENEDRDYSYMDFYM